MKKKILFVFVSLLTLAIFALPVMAAQPTETSITYFKQTESVLSTDWRYAGESNIFIVTESIRTGSIYQGSSSGPKLFDFYQIGKMKANPAVGKQVWHFDVIYTSITGDGGFEGMLNGQADSSNPNMYTVHGVLQGFGTLKGQRLVVEVTRISLNSALITGMLVIL
jgi:hypothetical protein